jgi:hypothetical protein
VPSVLCSKCSTELPSESQFCLKCGERVAAPAENPAPAAPETISDSSHRPMSRRHSVAPVLFWLFVFLILMAIAWAATSNSSLAQGIQESAGLRHDYGVVDSPFSVAAHNFRYYKFALPQGSRNVSIVGEFSAASEAGTKQERDADNSIEVFVLGEAALPVWQNGYATTSVYQSGKVQQAKMQADLPAGAGVYYLVFSNKFAPKSSKRVTADVLLRYGNWMPRSVQLAGQHFWDWLGM